MTDAAMDPLVIDEAAVLVQGRFFQFLCDYEDEESGQNFSSQATLMRQTETFSFFIHFEWLAAYDGDCAAAISSQYYRLEPYCRKALVQFLTLEDQAYMNERKNHKEFFVCFYNLPTVSPIRELKSGQLGTLVSFSGTVTRTSEVRPELLEGVFLCTHCGEDSERLEQQFKYAEPNHCPSPYCTNTSDFELRPERSTFVDWQRVKVQENSDEIPPGSMPRGIDVILRHENVEQAKAGDRVVFTGTLIVVPDVSQLAKNASGESVTATRAAGRENSAAGTGVRGLKALGVRELTYKMVFLACSVQTLEQRFNRISIRGELNNETEGNETENSTPATDDFTEEEIHRILEMRDDPEHYDKMAKSLCPSVYGHDEIRRGILLMLFGGVHKSSVTEKLKLRGDLNICIVGDPSTAKSQFLKYICSFLPRAIYTSGKVSSAAGLTASVIRDGETGEFCVEAGALMLADNGICCIDEFDKMDPMDQVAIHEAMEQQTISITKAGIHATLNARTSILAAANPYAGRYDRRKTLQYNVNITAPILSRFDLFFVILDECDEVSDRHIASHIVAVHQAVDNVIEPIYSQEDLQRYIKYARRFTPVISPAAKAVMIESYRRLRENDVVSAGDSGGGTMSYRITVRQLESMIRLSEARARLDLESVVKPIHVREAYRLLQKSIIHVDAQDVVLDTASSSVPLPDIGDLDIKTKSATDTSSSPQPEEDDLMMMEEDGGEEDKVSSRKNNTTLSMDAFLRIEKGLASYIRSEEDEDSSGCPQGQVVTWYLEQQELSSEDQLVTEHSKINAVVDRLVKDGTLLVLGEDENVEERYLAVHPNYAD